MHDSGTWTAQKDPEAEPDPAIFKALEEASKQLSAGREKVMADVALRSAPAATARAGLDTLTWANGAVYHAWRLAESLRIASGQQRIAP